MEKTITDSRFDGLSEVVVREAFVAAVGETEEDCHTKLTTDEIEQAALAAHVYETERRAPIPESAGVKAVHVATLDWQDRRAASYAYEVATMTYTATVLEAYMGHKLVCARASDSDGSTDPAPPPPPPASTCGCAAAAPLATTLRPLRAQRDGDQLVVTAVVLCAACGVQLDPQERTMTVQSAMPVPEARVVSMPDAPVTLADAPDLTMHAGLVFAEHMGMQVMATSERYDKAVHMASETAWAETLAMAEVIFASNGQRGPSHSDWIHLIVAARKLAMVVALDMLAALQGVHKFDTADRLREDAAELLEAWAECGRCRDGGVYPPKTP